VRRSRSNLVIKEHNPWKVFFWMTFAMVIVVVGVTMLWDVAYDTGHDQGDTKGRLTRSQVLRYQEMKKRADQRIDALKGQISKLRTEVARLESLNRIDGHAYKKIKSNVSSLTVKNQNLREEIQFYRNIVSPNKSYAGLRIHSFKIDQGVKQRLFHYRLILVQIHGLKNRHRNVSGIVRVSVTGKRVDGSRRVLSLRDIMPSSDVIDMKFSLKYYKSFEGSLKLPDGFTPVSVRVQVIPNRRTRGGRRSVEKKVQWPI